MFLGWIGSVVWVDTFSAQMNRGECGVSVHLSRFRHPPHLPHAQVLELPENADVSKKLKRLVEKLSKKVSQN